MLCLMLTLVLLLAKSQFIGLWNILKTLISTKGALGLSTTYDNQYIPSIQPVHPHKAVEDLI